MAGNRLLLDSPTPPKWGRTFSFAEPDPRTKRFPRHFFAGGSRDRAYVYHDPSFPLVSLVLCSCTTWASNLSCLIQRSCCVHAIGNEIIGTAFRTGFQILYPPGCTPPCPLLILATSDILASPHPHHLHHDTELSPPSRPPHDQTIIVDWL